MLPALYTSHLYPQGNIPVFNSVRSRDDPVSEYGWKDEVNEKFQ